MSDEAQKNDGGKPPMGLLDTFALVQIARVLAFGAQKYAAHNWRKGMEWSRMVDAMLRHILAWNDGEDNDPESGLSHLAHAGCCLMFLLNYELTHTEFDDRYRRAVGPVDSPEEYLCIMCKLLKGRA
jgi:hypothetical protein